MLCRTGFKFASLLIVALLVVAGVTFVTVSMATASSSALGSVPRGGLLFGYIIGYRCLCFSTRGIFCWDAGGTCELVMPPLCTNLFLSGLSKFLELEPGWFKVIGIDARVLFTPVPPLA